MTGQPLPPPEPKRRLSRPAFLALAAIALVAFCANAWFVSHEELVSWNSPIVDGTGRRVRLLLPRGWQIDDKWEEQNEADYSRVYVSFSPRHHAPRMLKWLARDLETAYMELLVTHVRSRRIWASGAIRGYRFADTVLPYYSNSSATDRKAQMIAELVYKRSNQGAFEATRSAIANSLRIE